ncbi:putative baseplate assembly protein [Achromobacter deleyi]|uniref:putative baseplate assembly protein n=1 Tax=Achromobacter deleyi TaxID=1353891 RepID=UPI0014919E02|nr:putative baseplate assembly protein [Achromobacter deleyi]QVQ26390.1 putative baseplate assembly protein [Achromobacter deleyi]UIP21954.1 putative baseplate assembly protein [Achromobacter deleyi]
MNRQFRSANPRRLQLLRAQQPPGENGIAYVEIDAADQRTLRVVCAHPVSGIGRAHVRIEGGVRIRGIALAADPVLSGNEIRLTVDRAGDFSWYTLALVNPAEPDAPAPGFDLCLSTIEINFKAGCPSEFDCADARACDPPAPPEPLLDYLAKDYESFRRLMLDRLSQSMPDFTERNPADFTVALVETLAYAADHLSYAQDAVATEAYLDTARRRSSLRRHARLLDYPLHDGCNARVFVAFEVNPQGEGCVVPAGTPMLTSSPEAALAAPVRRREALDGLPMPGVEVFETLHELTLHAAHSRIALHDFADPAYCLPRGQTQAALVNDPPLALASGDVLVFEEAIGPLTGRQADADREHRHAVRLTETRTGRDDLTGTDLLLVAWHPDDALPFPLCVSREFNQGGALVKQAVSVALGNVVLADHGLNRNWIPLQPDTATARDAPAARPYRPRLPDTGLAYAEPYHHDQAVSGPRPASQALTQDPRRALPSGMRLLADDPDQPGDVPPPAGAPWSPHRGLLASARDARDFVVETETDGSAWLRFGDNRYGAAPVPGERLLARYRLGGGPGGNVGANAIGALVTDDPDLMLGVARVRNPMPAQGGAAPEPADAIRLNAPEAFRVQERAVTADDYARLAERHPQVQRAAARLRWTGSWHTVFLTVDRRGGLVVDAPFRATMRGFMERFRLAGQDIEFSEPVHVPLDILLRVCAAPGHFAADVKAALRDAFTSGLDRAGRPGFFHPDRYTFGTPLALSALMSAVMAVPGVASAQAERFQRWGRDPAGELDSGRILTAPLEVLRADGDPNFPENGRIDFIVEGGS